MFLEADHDSDLDSLFRNDAEVSSKDRAQKNGLCIQNNSWRRRNLGGRNAAWDSLIKQSFHTILPTLGGYHRSSLKNVTTCSANRAEVTLRYTHIYPISRLGSTPIPKRLGYDSSEDSVFLSVLQSTTWSLQRGLLTSINAYVSQSSRWCTYDAEDSQLEAK